MKEKELYYRYEHKTENSDTFVLKEKMLYGAGLNCFKNKEDATKHFKNAEEIAQEKYSKIMDGIEKLKDLVGDFSYNYFMSGDTYGIEEDGLYISFEVNGYNFTFSQDSYLK